MFDLIETPRRTQRQTPHRQTTRGSCRGGNEGREMNAKSKPHSLHFRISAFTPPLPSPHLTDMKKTRRRCIPEYGLRLSRYFGTSPGFWLRLQLDFELLRAARQSGELINREVQPHAA